ncbi:MAG: tRNA lysidine(34) synthetase TilS [Planctomycetota bacterium]
MSSTPPIPAAEAAFLAALAAGLPPAHDWAFPSLVAVSGGADSVALSLAVARLTPAAAVSRLVIAHADHGLRAESAADAEFVRQLAERLGTRFVGRRLDVAAAVGREGLEGRARRLRYEFLAEAAHEAGARHVLVAHTADDQAETILHRLLRGTGVAGLAGMRRSRRLADGVALLRPLLHVPRASVRAFLAAAGQDWREDATNADLGRARNFLRHAILPRCTVGPIRQRPRRSCGSVARRPRRLRRSRAPRSISSTCTRADGTTAWSCCEPPAWAASIGACLRRCSPGCGTVSIGRGGT